jgi:hypothetical protein
MVSFAFQIRFLSFLALITTSVKQGPGTVSNKIRRPFWVNKLTIFGKKGEPSPQAPNQSIVNYLFLKENINSNKFGMNVE